MSDAPAPPPRAVVYAFVFFLATRMLILFSVPPLLSDVGLYAEYAVLARDLGQTPYADFKVEYPPVSYWLVAAPRLLITRTLDAPGPIPAGFLREYRFFFRVEMLFCELAAFSLFLQWTQRRRPEFLSAAAWAIALLGFILAPVLYDRLDAALLTLLMLWAWAFDVSRDAPAPLGWLCLSGAALGLGVAHKLVPLVALPFFALAVHSRLKRLGPTLACAAATLAGAIGPFAIQWAVSGDGVFWLFRFHSERGVEVESLYASIEMALCPWLPVHGIQGPGSWDTDGPLSAALARASTFVILGILAGLGLVCWQRRADSETAFRLGVLAIVMATLFSKVLSTQYLVWLLPLTLLLGADLLAGRGFACLVAALIVAAALTTLIFPFHFMQVRHPATGGIEIGMALLQGLEKERSFHPLTAALLGLRNLLLLASAAALLRSLLVGRAARTRGEG